MKNTHILQCAKFNSRVLFVSELYMQYSRLKQFTSACGRPCNTIDFPAVATHLIQE